MIRIAIADDHPVVREGLGSVLDDEADFSIVASTSAAEDIIHQAAAIAPDVVLLDFEMPGLSGGDAVREILRALPKTGIIIFTAYADDDRVVGALRSGARGYVLKGAPAAEVAQAIREVHAGRSYLPPAIAASVARHVGDPQRSSLTAREREVLRLVADGLSNKQVARRLHIAERTVKYHVTSAMTKLGAENRAQAVALALRRRVL
jgi:DNA-binding NarL/FixJ family response regulator